MGLIVGAELEFAVGQVELERAVGAGATVDAGVPAPVVVGVYPHVGDAVPGGVHHPDGEGSPTSLYRDGGHVGAGDDLGPVGVGLIVGAEFELTIGQPQFEGAIGVGAASDAGVPAPLVVGVYPHVGDAVPGGVHHPDGEGTFAGADLGICLCWPGDHLGPVMVQLIICPEAIAAVAEVKVNLAGVVGVAPDAFVPATGVKGIHPHVGDALAIGVDHAHCDVLGDGGGCARRRGFAAEFGGHLAVNIAHRDAGEGERPKDEA